MKMLVASNEFVGVFGVSGVTPVNILEYKKGVGNRVG